MELRNTDKRLQPSLFQGIDWVTVLIYLILVAFGAVSIYAASYDFDDASMFSFTEFSGKQFRWIGLSLVMGTFLLLIDRRIYETYAYPIYMLVVLLLIATIFLATDIKGSRSWIKIGSAMSLQPAEFGKFATALALAKLFSGYNFVLNAKPSNYLKAFTIIFIPIILILAQKETGSALVYLSLFFVLYREGMSGLVLGAALVSVVIFVVSVKYPDILLLGIPSGEFCIMLMIMVLMVVMLALYAHHIAAARNVGIWFLAGIVTIILLEEFEVQAPGSAILMSLMGIAILYILFELLRIHNRRLFVIAGAAIISVGFLFSVNYVFTQVLEPYQQMRIKVALGIEEDLRGVGYNVNQSKIAIGSGGFSGKGFLKGTQTKLKYVPEQHTDFIFCTIGEEEGFIGTVGVMSLFLILILRVINIAERQPTVFARVYSYCVAGYFIFHFCINIGMVIGLCPVIGIPLPFFSYGGSSLWGFTILLFIMLRLDAARNERR